MSNFLGFKKITKEDSLQYKDILMTEKNRINAIRGYYLFLLGIVIEPLLIIIFDIPNITTYGITHNRTYLYLFLHILLLVVSIFGFIQTRNFQKKEALTTKELKNYERNAFLIPLIYLISVAFINGLDQQTVESISIYTTFALIIAAFVIAQPTKSAIMFGISHLVFIVGIVVFQESSEIALVNIINGTIIVSCAYVISVLSYFSFFTNTKNYSLLQKSKEKCELLSNTDFLTNINNRRYGMNRLKEQFSLSKRSNIPFGLLLIDVDDFKNVNDKYGHLLGDETLISIVNQLKSNLRTEDIIIRYGGEEFLIILPNSELSGLRQVGSKLLSVVEGHLFDINGYQFNMTISIGGVSFPEFKSEEVIKLLEEADRRLYVAKNSGKNKIVTE